MRYKNFVEYMNNRMNPMNVSKTGEITKDNYLRFTLVSDVQNETIIAASVTDAVYDALNLIIATKIPNASELMSNENTSDVKNNLLGLLDFSQFKITAEKIGTESGESKTLSIIIEYKSPFSEDTYTYQLSLDESFETDMNPFDSIIDVSVEDDIIIAWVRKDDHTIICEVKYSFLMMTKPTKKDCLEVGIETVYQTVLGAIMGSKQNGVLVAGFSSANPDDGDEFNLDLGKDLSLKRALLQKIKIDKSIYKSRAYQNKHVVKLINNAISKDNRIVRHLDKREHQLKETINNIIEN